MTSFEQEIKTRLGSLSKNGKIFFSILTCEKLYPYYVAFEEKYKWGNSEILADAISLTYEFLINRNAISVNEIMEMLSKIDLITPDMDDFGSALSSFALNASTSTYSTLQYLLDGNIDHIADVVSYTLDTIDMFIQEKEDMNTLDPSRDIQIDHDDFMLQEQQRERDLIDRLLKINLDTITDSLIDSLRDGKPIIDLSLLPE